MRIYDNGIYRDMTEEEIARYANVPQIETEITESERLDALEAAFMELAEVVLNG